jgi:calcineurin-like phosphoesterase family protein
MSAPWGIEFNEEELVILEFFIEVLVSEDKNTFVLGDFSEDTGDE